MTLRRWLAVALIGLGGAAGAGLGAVSSGHAPRPAFGSALLLAVSFLIGWSNTGSL